MKKYAGITLGPIYDTMMLSSRPAGMWAASFLFSCMGKELCAGVQELYKERCHLIVPGTVPVSSEEAQDLLAGMKAGVGLIHDRLIFAIESPLSEIEIAAELEEKVIEPVRQHTAARILADIAKNQKRAPAPEAQAELARYFQIYGICAALEESEPIVPVISGALDALELEKQFAPKVTRDYLHLFLNDNEIVKNCFLTAGITEREKWQLLDPKGRVRNIEDVCGSKPYFALVQADGDGMGKVLCSLTDASQVKRFSEKCLRYAAKASNTIGENGGVTIYAGGDDLLFLVPVEPERKNLLTLLKEIKDIFRTEFHEPEYGKCSLSFGAQIVYKKFPLYEAFQMAGALLFGEAKRKRNSCAVSLQKHSGQSAAFTIHEFETNPVTQQLIALTEAKKEGKFLRSVSQHIMQNRKLFEVGIKTQTLDRLIPNLFDSGEQKKYEGQIRQVAELLSASLSEPVSFREGNSLAILALLRFADFYSTGGGEADEERM